MRVLLAENNLANSLVARSILLRDGHHVRVARNGAETIQLALRDPYDVILLDIMMPVLDGLQTVQRFRRPTGMSARGGPRLFALTAYDSPEDIATYWEAGFDGMIAKPLRSGDLDRAFTISAGGAMPTLNCLPEGTSERTYHPLLDESVIHNGPGQADELTRTRIWRSYRESLSDALREISYTLPGCVARDRAALARFRKALHSLRSASLMVGMDRAPHLAGQLRDVPEDRLVHDVANLLRAVRDSLPLLEALLVEASLSSVAARKGAVGMQMGGEH